MRKQRNAAFTDEIITNIKQFQTDTDCDKPDEMIVSHAKEKTVISQDTARKISVHVRHPSHVETVALMVRE